MSDETFEQKLASAASAMLNSMAILERERDELRRQMEARYDCHAGPGTTQEACGACLTCVMRERDALRVNCDSVAKLYYDAINHDLKELDQAGYRDGQKLCDLANELRAKLQASEQAKLTLSTDLAITRHSRNIAVELKLGAQRECEQLRAKLAASEIAREEMRTELNQSLRQWRHYSNAARECDHDEDEDAEIEKSIDTEAQFYASAKSALSRPPGETVAKLRALLEQIASMETHVEPIGDEWQWAVDRAKDAIALLNGGAK